MNATKVGDIDTKNNWQERKDVALKKVYTSLDKLIADAKNRANPVSLAVFKPTKITGFKIKTSWSRWGAFQKYLKRVTLYNL